MSLQDKLQIASAEFQKLQVQMASAVEARQKLDAQLSENELVKKEFERLTAENTIYKQMGPVLVKQDEAEAKSNVGTRIEYIRSEIKRMEGQLKDLQSQSEAKKKQIIDLQQTAQA